jgi:hypothetical protein
MYWRIGIAGFLGLLFLIPSRGHSQGTCGGGGRFHLRPAPEVLIAPIPSPADLDAGQVEAGVMTVTIIPRGTPRDWELCLRVTEPFMGGAGKPSSDVEYWSAGGSAWQPASTSDRVVARGRGRSQVEVRFRVRVDWTDEPGSYSSVMALTLASN